MNLGFYLTPQAKIYSRWITSLDVKAKSIKLLQENIEEYLYDFGAMIFWENTTTTSD